MDLIKKHVDTVIVLGGILSAVLWMNNRFNNLEKEMGELKTDMAVMKTVLIMKNVMPKELAANVSVEN
jgi:hypothetical protein